MWVNELIYKATNQTTFFFAKYKPNFFILFYFGQNQTYLTHSFANHVI